MQPQSQMKPLAIIGFTFRFPQDAISSEGFWKIIEERKYVMTEIPDNRMNMDAFYHPTQSRVDKFNLRRGHFLKQDLGTFDAPFFPISPAEAVAMDLQQRGLLEATYHSLENRTLDISSYLQESNSGITGIPVGSVSDSATSVFTGSFGTTIGFLV